MDDECKQVLKEKVEILEKEIKKLQAKLETSNLKESTCEIEERFHRDNLSEEYFKKFKNRKSKETIKKELKNEISNFLITSPLLMSLVALSSFIITKNVGVLEIILAGTITAACHVAHFNNKVKEEKDYIKGFNSQLNEEMIIFHEDSEEKACKFKNLQISNSNEIYNKIKAKEKELLEINNILKPNHIQEEKEIIKQKTK